jgi:serine/threonine protein kinase
MIHFSCFHCGLKLKVRPEFAGRFARCPTCKQPLVVPVPDAAPAEVPMGQIDGAPSSLARAGADYGVTLEPSSRRRGERSIEELLAAQGQNRQRYVVGGEIARGGMGAVLRAVDCDIRREVAVKYLLDQTVPAKKLRFIEEAQITGQLEHPNIVPVHELGFDAQQRLFFSMKMVRGRSLAQILDALRADSPLLPGEGPGVRASAEKEFPLSRLLNIFVSVANAIAYAHSRGVIHRDLKPANIMVGDFGEVYVMDWGLAKVLKDGQSSDRVPPPPAAAGVPAGSGLQSLAGRVATSRAADADLTVDGEVLGTPAYMPPEQATGQIQAIDQRSDIYSLGAILYAMLALRPPVGTEGHYAAVLLRVAEGKIPPPEEGNARRVRAGQIPRELSAVAMKALAKEPEKRYQAVEALRRDIELFQEGRSVSAKDDTRWEQFSKLVRRNKGLSLGVAVAVLVLLCSLGVVGKAWWETNRAYAAYQKEQEDKAERTRQAVPAFVKVARLAVNQLEFDEALSEVSLALDYAPEQTDARLLKGQLLIWKKDYAGARRELETYLAKQPQAAGASPAELAEKKSHEQAIAGLVELCQRKDPDEPSTLLAFAHLLEQQKAPVLADALLVRYGRNTPEARQAVLDSYRKRIEAAWPGRGNNLSMDDAGVVTLSLDWEGDLVRRLNALEGMPLGRLSLFRCSVADLSPLRGMPLVELNLSDCKAVRDLSPLRGMPLAALNIEQTGVDDLSPLRGIPLTTLTLGNYNLRDFSPLKGMPLNELNIHCPGFSDLSLLKGMPLTRLSLLGCRVRDLSLLRGMALTSLDVRKTDVEDLSPLRDMPLTTLKASDSRVQDLSPLRGMRLTDLELIGCGSARYGRGNVHDLSPLMGMRLVSLDLSETNVQDLSPLKGMPLTFLHLYGCDGVEDLSPLEGAELSDVFLPPHVAKGMDAIRRMKSLKKINNQPADEFWKNYDAAEAKK